MATKLNVTSRLFNQKDILDVEENIATQAQIDDITESITGLQEDKADKDFTPQIYYTNQEPDELNEEEGLLDKLKVGDIVVSTIDDRYFVVLSRDTIDNDLTTRIVEITPNNRQCNFQYYYGEGEWICDEENIGYLQVELESGDNIKTINDQSILGSGNLTVGGTELYQHEIEYTNVDDDNVRIFLISKKNTAYSNKNEIGADWVLGNIVRVVSVTVGSTSINNILGIDSSGEYIYTDGSVINSQDTYPVQSGWADAVTQL